MHAAQSLILMILQSPLKWQSVRADAAPLSPMLMLTLPQERRCCSRSMVAVAALMKCSSRCYRCSRLHAANSVAATETHADR
jgi:hypothetical protein